MDGLKRRTPAGQWQGFEKAQTKGDGLQSKYNPNAAPASFWRGFDGTENMAPPVTRKPNKPADTLWRPRPEVSL